MQDSVFPFGLLIGFAAAGGFAVFWLPRVVEIFNTLQTVISAV